jgi:hypothetical protein
MTKIRLSRLAPLRPLLAVAAITATFVLLLADSAQKCPHSAQTVTFVADDGCLAGGHYLVSSSGNGDSCALNFGGDDVGLPSGATASGEFSGGQYDLNAASWMVSGPASARPLPDGGARAPVQRYCSAVPADGGLSVSCSDATDGGGCTVQLKR